MQISKIDGESSNLTIFWKKKNEYDDITTRGSEVIFDHDKGKMFDYMEPTRFPKFLSISLSPEDRTFTETYIVNGNPTHEQLKVAIADK